MAMSIIFLPRTFYVIVDTIGVAECSDNETT